MRKASKVAIDAIPNGCLPESEMNVVLDFVGDGQFFYLASICKHVTSILRQRLLLPLRVKVREESGDCIGKRLRSRPPAIDDAGNLVLSHEHEQWPYVSTLRSAVQTAPLYKMVYNQLDDFKGLDMDRAVGRSGNMDVISLHLSLNLTARDQLFNGRDTLNYVVDGAIKGRHFSILELLCKRVVSRLSARQDSIDKSYNADLHTLQQCTHLAAESGTVYFFETLLEKLNVALTLCNQDVRSSSREMIGPALAQSGKLTMLQKYYSDLNRCPRRRYLTAAVASGNVQVVEFFVPWYLLLPYVGVVLVMSATWLNMPHIIEWWTSKQSDVSYDAVIQYTEQYIAQYTKEDHKVHRRSESPELVSIRGSHNKWWSEIQRIARMHIC